MEVRPRLRLDHDHYVCVCMEVRPRLRLDHDHDHGKIHKQMSGKMRQISGKMRQVAGKMRQMYGVCCNCLCLLYSCCTRMLMSTLRLLTHDQCTRSRKNKDNDDARHWEGRLGHSTNVDVAEHAAEVHVQQDLKHMQTSMYTHACMRAHAHSKERR